MTESAIYRGTVVHRRFKPKRHELRYGCYWLLLDLDELPQLHRTLRLFSHDRWNVFSLRSSDHGAQSDEPLRAYVEGQLASAGLEAAGRSIRLLTMPRLYGYAFNPLSVYFCYGATGALMATLYEVRNTFGERHSYLIPVEQSVSDVIVQHCSKAFYVSPFMDMNLDYEFRLNPPGEALSLAIGTSDTSGKVLDAWLTATREPLTDRSLVRLLASHPLLTLKVIAAIHYEAVKLVLKGVKLRTRPNPPKEAVTVVQPISQPRGAA